MVFKHLFSFVLLQMLCIFKERMREIIGPVFCTFCMACLSNAVSRHRQDCNRQSMQ